MRYIKVADVRRRLKEKGKRMAKNFPIALSAEVEKLIDKACHSAGPSFKTVTQLDLAVGMTGFHGGRRG